MNIHIKRKIKDLQKLLKSGLLSSFGKKKIKLSIKKLKK